MAFLSSKLLQEIQTIFSMTEDPEQIKTAEQQLLKLRAIPEFQLLLATFLSRSSNHHHRIFAALQLEKRIVMKESQTICLLNQCYFQDLDKIAGILRKILSDPHNCQWVSSLLCSFNYEMMGIVQSVRAIELLFSLLEEPDQGSTLVRNHFEQFLTCFSFLIEIVLENEDVLFMLLVTLGIFYSHVLHLQEGLAPASIKHQLNSINQKCKFYGNPLIQLLLHSIHSSVLNSAPSFPEGGLGELVFNILSFKFDQVRMKYQNKCLELVVASGTVFDDKKAVLEFILGFNRYSYQSNSDKLKDSSQFRVTELCNQLQFQMENKYDKLGRQCLSQLILELFLVHYQQVARSLQFQQGPFFLYLMPLVTYYGSTKCAVIEEWVADHIEKALHQMGLILDRVYLEDQPKKLNDWVTCLQFVVGYKQFVPIGVLPHLGKLMQQMASYSVCLSPLCYQVLEQISPELCSLDFIDISDFLLAHLKTLNQNEWDHSVAAYSCFLNLALHLQDRYQFFSHLLLHDPLVDESLKAQTILADLLKETPECKVEVDVVIKLLTLTGYVFLGMDPTRLREFHHKLRVSFLADLLQRHRLYHQENVGVVIWEEMITGRMPVNLEYISLEGANSDGDQHFKGTIRRELERFSELKTMVRS